MTFSLNDPVVTFLSIVEIFLSVVDTFYFYSVVYTFCSVVDTFLLSCRAVESGGAVERKKFEESGDKNLKSRESESGGKKLLTPDSFNVKKTKTIQLFLNQLLS